MNPIFLATALILLTLADVYTTRVGLGLRGVRKSNPLIRWLMLTGGPLWIVIKLVMSAGAAYLLLPYPGALFALCAIYAFVVASNVAIISRNRS